MIYKDDREEDSDIAGIIGHGKEAEKRKKEFCETFPVIAQLRGECD